MLFFVLVAAIVVALLIFSGLRALKPLFSIIAVGVVIYLLLSSAGWSATPPSLSAAAPTAAQLDAEARRVCPTITPAVVMAFLDATPRTMFGVPIIPIRVLWVRPRPTISWVMLPGGPWCAGALEYAVKKTGDVEVIPIYVQIGADPGVIRGLAYGY